MDQCLFLEMETLVYTDHRVELKLSFPKGDRLICRTQIQVEDVFDESVDELLTGLEHGADVRMVVLNQLLARQRRRG